MPQRYINFGVFALGVLLTAVSAIAQPKPGYEPTTTHIYPAGGRRGTTVSVRVGTECFPPHTNFIISGEGVRAPDVLGENVPSRGEPSLRRVPTEIPITYPREWQSQIEISADAPLGPAYWRLSCSQGGSGSRPFIIGDLPELIESESNSTPDRAESVSLPVTLNGQIDGERDVDHFRFDVDAGETIVCEVLAGRIASRLDPVVDLLDTNGRKVPSESVHIGSDPVIAYRAESARTLYLRVANVTFHGSPAHVYRINVTKSPFVHYSFPSGGQAGSEQDVQFYVLTGTGQPEVITRRVMFPAEPTDSFSYFDETLSANSIRFSVDSVPNIVEQESNNDRETAAEFFAPATINGQFLTADDEDWFRFTADKDQHFTITCRAFSPGMPTLPVIALVDKDGQQLQQVRSVEAQNGDCHIEWAAPSAGTYYLRARDLRFGSRGGADFVYRISINTAQPDFAVSLATDSINVVQGGTLQMDVAVVRFGGFNEPIELVIEGLPEYVIVSDTTIAAGARAGKVKFEVGDDVPAQSIPLRVIARSKIGVQTVERAASAKHLGVDSEGVSVGSPTIDRLHLTVMHKPVFRLFCGEAYQYAHRGSVFPYLMEVERLDGFDEPIVIQRGDRQNRDMDGIDMLDAIVPPGKSEVILPIYLPETMHINVQSQSQLYSQAYATFTDKHGRQQSVLVLSEKRNMLRTLPPVVKLVAVDEEFRAKCGADLSCRLKLERTSNFPGPMQIELIEPTANGAVITQPAEIARGQNDIEVKLRVADNMPRDTETQLRFRATGKLNEQIVVISEAVVRLHVE